ncbi:hypothetical protein [Aeoliella sp.]|uniref:hypothetical protein n=1 Tax=Aeoliella sp. TaxID=2795800 RepID=UPI003CCC1CD4
MADKYLVPCTCGKSVSVTVHQAGSRVPCVCGTPVDVPPLRKLRTLERDEQIAEEATAAWTAQHSFAFGGTVLTLALLAVAGWMTATQPETPDFGKGYQQQLAARTDVMLEKGKPIDFWMNWLHSEPTLTEYGFDEISTAQEVSYQQQLDERLMHRNIVLGLAGVVVVLTVVGGTAWPKSTSSSASPN